MPSPSIFRSQEITKENRNNKNGSSKNKMLTAILERTKFYIPLKKSVDSNNGLRKIICSRRYAEIGKTRPRSDAFLEPYMQGLGNELNSENFDENLFKNKQHRNSEEISRSVPSTPDDVRDGGGVAPFRLLQENLGSQGSLQSMSGEECSGDSGSISSSVCDDEETPDISLTERLIRSHPIWFLPDIQRAGAFHLLQGKEEGNFVVRQSSQNTTMAISVRLPTGKGPYIEHYLIQASPDGQIGLETSDNKFINIPSLIAHYCQCCDELPVQLTLPRAIREAKNRQLLTSLALLGQEFWRYPMANPRTSLKCEEGNLSPVPASTPTQKDEQQTRSNSPLISSSSNSPASSLSSFDSGGNVVVDTNSILELENTSQPASLMTTFKGTVPAAIPHNQIGIPVTSECVSLPVEASQDAIVPKSRPTPPNSLNLVTTSSMVSNSVFRATSISPGQPVSTPTSKTPPPPPPRWAKPSPSSTQETQNFTVTTTLTFSVNKELSPPPQVQVACIQVSSPANSLSGNIGGHISPFFDPPIPLPRSQTPQTHPASAVTSPIGQTPQILSPVSEGHTRPFHRRTRRYKESRHYRESNILESCKFHRSALGDKVSDYEDIWGPDSSLSTFKPQPAPRSSPFSSLDNSETKDKSLTDQEPLDIPQVTTPVDRVPNKNRFGLILNTAVTPCSPETPLDISNSFQSVSPVTSESNTPEPMKTEPKLGSPSYADPVDAINQTALLRRKGKSPNSFTSSQSKNRHSEPSSFQQWAPLVSGGGVLERIDSKEELITSNSFSSSVDNLIGLRNSRRGSNNMPCGRNAKPVHPPKIKKKSHETSWTVDSSWEFIGNENEGCENETPKTPVTDGKFPCVETTPPKDLTIRQLITQRCSNLQLSPILGRGENIGDNDNKDNKGISDCSSRISAYDNVNNNDINNIDKVYHNGLSVLSQISDNSDDTQTEFSEPWDSSYWDHLLSPTSEGEEYKAHLFRCKSFKERLDPLLAPPRVKALSKTRTEAENGDAMTPGAAIKAYALQLAADKRTVFSKSIENFIACTKESREVRPQVVMRNMRQFMSGMKNYLVKHGEKGFEKEVQKERSKLKANEFLNLDAILEGVMHTVVITPLKEHLYTLFVDEYMKNGAIQVLNDNIKYARTKTPQEMGIRDKVIPPSEENLQKIFQFFDNLQAADSPLEKLEHLLAAISEIFHSVRLLNKGAVLLGADDFLPLFIWVLVQSGMVAAEIEAEYMWGLLHPSLLSGEGGYYLTTLSSAVNVLKNFRECSDKESTYSYQWYQDPLSEFRSVLKVVVPDELNGSLLTKTLPVRPNMTVRDICKIIALKLRITNPQDYTLFKLVEGEETLLNESDCPQDVKIDVTRTGKHCIFAYKRIDAKIGWPNTSPTD